MNLFKNILQSGVTDDLVYQERRGVLLSNYISFILSFAILVLYVFKTTFHGSIKYGLNSILLLFGLFLFLIPILLNRLEFTRMARLSLCILPVGFLWFVYVPQMQQLAVIETSIYDSMRIFLLSFSFIPYLIFDKNKPGLLILGILPAFISVLFFEAILQFAGVGHSQMGIQGDDYQLMQIRTFVAFAILSGASYTFHNIISVNDAYNLKMQKILKEKSAEIARQNKELNNLNAHLEELVEKKTENIRKQNEVLVSYAHSNSHHLRAPVARLLGLLHLSKLEKEVDYPQFINKVEKEANTIDEVVRDISKEINDLGDVE